MKERERERGPSLALLLSFVIAAGGLNLAVGGLMQVVVQHGAGAGLPSVEVATKIELIDGVEIDREPASLDDPVPAALIFLEEPMRETVPEDATHSGEYDHNVEEETRAQQARDPGSARGRQTSPAQPAQAETSAGPSSTPRPESPARQALDGGGAEQTAPAPRAGQPAPPPLPDDPDGAQAARPPAKSPAPQAASPSVAGPSQQPSPPSPPAPATSAPDAASMQASMQEVFGGGGSHQAIEEGLADGPRDDVRTVHHDFAGFFNRIREEIVKHWDPNAAIADQTRETLSAIHRRTRVTLLRVRLRKDGAVDRIWIDRSSGFDLLDEHAIRAVRAGSPFANLPPALQTEQGGKLVFSMEFRFTKGGQRVLRMGP